MMRRPPRSPLLPYTTLSRSPQLEDATSIQSAISEVCELMLHRRIEPKEASALFYAMQVASTNLAFVNALKNRTLNPETRSEEHTSELQSPDHLVCRLLLQIK